MSNANSKNHQKNGSVVWVTGLSGAGKTTLAEKISSDLRSSGWNVVLLDGDVLREALGIETQHNTEDRLAIAKKYSNICQIIASQGFVVVIATISMFAEVHSWNRQNLPGYIEVFLKVPITELKRRDAKGIYKKFQNGEAKNISGLDLAVDEPQNADWVEIFDPLKPQPNNAEKLISYIKVRLQNEN
jgi:adenylylsulfate kinase